jgi:hypothetical protein
MYDLQTGEGQSELKTARADAGMQTQRFLLWATALFIALLIWLGLTAIGQRALGVYVAVAALLVMAWGIRRLG